MESLLKVANSATQPLVPVPWAAGLVGTERNLVWVKNSFGDYRAIRNAFKVVFLRRRGGRR